MQIPEQVAQDIPGRFRPGQSGNPSGRLSNAARRERIEAKARELADEFGGIDALTPIERVMLTTASELIVRRPRTSEDSVRVANAIGRLLNTLQKRRGRERPDTAGPSIPSMAECLEMVRAK